jgi:hypothetical protein
MSFLFFSEFFICVLKASLKTLQESFPVIFLLIVDMTDLRLYFYYRPFFQVILDKSQQFIFCSDSLQKRLIPTVSTSSAARFSLSFLVHFHSKTIVFLD